MSLKGPAEQEVWHFSVDQNGVAVLVFNLPDSPVNLLTSRALGELEARILEAERNPKLRGLVILSGKEGFIAGADIREIARIRDEEEARALITHGQGILDRLSRLPFNTVCAIHGACLGGGLELALACRKRIATLHPETQFGFPEIKLGLIPGLGGTQRAPRQVGLLEALKLITTGRALGSSEAKRIGLVDEVVPVASLKERASTLAAQKTGSLPKHHSFSKRLWEGNPIGRYFLFRGAWKRITQRASPHRYPALGAAVSAIRQSREPLSKGLRAETELFSKLLFTKTCRNLIALYHATRTLEKTAAKETAARIRRVGVLGAGLMGTGIARVLAEREREVRLKDIDHETLARGIRRLFDGMKAPSARSQGERLLPIHRIAPTVDWSGFKRVDLVIEAVAENLEVKQQVLVEFESVNDHAIFASNTSSLSITAIASKSRRPERVAGMHFFNPVERMPLVEIIAGEKTGEETISTLLTLSKHLGKTAIPVQDRPGFFVNRVLHPYLNEALLLLEEGYPVEVIDRVMVKFGMPMGPVELLDHVGLDIAAEVSRILGRAFHDRIPPSTLLDQLIQEGRLGKKNGRGFYRYEGRKRRPDGALLLRLASKKLTRGEILKQEEIVLDRLLLGMLNEAVRALEEGVIREQSHGDVGLILGIGFPAYTGGPFRYLDQRGLGMVYAKLIDLRSRYGERFEPAPLLDEMTHQGRHFYDE